MLCWRRLAEIRNDAPCSSLLSISILLRSPAELLAVGVVFAKEKQLQEQNRKQETAANTAKHLIIHSITASMTHMPY